MRWRQDKDTGEFIPIDEAARQSDGLIHVRGFEAFRSPVDGSIIRNHRDLDHHNKRNNVRHYEHETPKPKTEPSTAEVFKRKQQLHEIFVRSEQGLPISKPRGIYEE